MTDSKPKTVLGGTDLACAAVLGLALGLAYCATFQTRMYGDGPGLVTFFAREITTGYHHALYLPTLQLLAALSPVSGPYAVPELLSVLSGATLGAATFGIARALGGGRAQAVSAALAATLSPAGWFFATTVELPIFHGAVVAVAACAALCAPWERFWRALFVSAAFFCLVFPSHQTGALLGPGWVALCALAARRKGHPIGLARALFVVGPVLLAALGLSMVGANVLRGESALALSVDTGIVDFFRGSASLGAFLWRGWLAPVALLVPAAIWGVVRGRGQALAAALLLGLPLVVLAWWRVPERGAYVVAGLPFYAALAARLPRALLAVLVALQATLAWLWIDAWDRGFDPTERVELVRDAVGEAGELYSLNAGAPEVSVFLPRVRETNLKDLLMPVYLDGHGPEAWAAVAADGFRFLAERGAVAFDLSFEKLEGNRTAAAARPYLDAVFAALEDDYTLRRHPHPWWEIGVLERRADTE